MMARPSKEDVALARAKAVLLTQGAADRVAARQCAIDPAKLEELSSGPLLLLADKNRRKQAIEWASAACHAATIAQAISGPARAALAELIADDTRSFALRHRALALPAIPLSDLCDQLAETAAMMAVETSTLLEGAPSSSKERACLDAALAELAI